MHYILVGVPSLLLIILSGFLLSKIWLLSKIKRKCTRCELLKLHHGMDRTKGRRNTKACQTRGTPEEGVVRFIYPPLPPPTCLHYSPLVLTKHQDSV